jgi:hypothetical protein
MGEKTFLDQIKNLQEVYAIQDFCSGLGRMRGPLVMQGPVGEKLLTVP